MEEQINLNVEQSIDINVNEDITVHIYRSPQGYVLDTYSVADGSHISTETIWADEYLNEAALDEESSKLIGEICIRYFGVDCRSMTTEAMLRLYEDLIMELDEVTDKEQCLELVGGVNPHVYGLKHNFQYEDCANIKDALQSMPCPINPKNLSDQDIKEIFEECSKVFDSYDTLGEWNNEADQEWWEVLEKEALAHGCTYYEDED